MTQPPTSHTACTHPIFIGFDAPIKEYLGLAFGAAFFNMLTLGLYKPYAITHTRRLLYKHTYIDGRPMVYHGDARSLSRYTFYPSLIFLLFIMVPGLMQFFLTWQGILTLCALQVLFLATYAHIIAFYNKRYELSHISWNDHYLTLTGSTKEYSRFSLLSQIANILTLGLLTPWRRATLSNKIYNNLFIGAHPVESVMTSRPLWLPYLLGWVLSWFGLFYAGWYYWQEAILPVQNILNGGMADLSMAAEVNASSFGNSGMGAISQQTLAEIGTFMHALTIGFFVYPAWVLWRKFCLCFYENSFRYHWAINTTCCEANLYSVGTPLGFFFRDGLSFIMNFFTANLTRPISTYLRQRYATNTLIIQNPEKLKNRLAPLQKKPEISIPLVPASPIIK